ncbi:MAG: tetratricopeptide repeat protein [Bacteroidota bacterium]|nr:tetratricopeptide repeat protein [Bacteroidota bacterium]
MMRDLEKVILLSVLMSVSLAAPSQTSDMIAREFFNEGTYKVTINDYKGAICALSEAIKLDSGFLQAYENRGVAKYHLQDYNGALYDFDKALKINPYDYSTYGRRGWVKYRLQDLHGAISDFTMALQGNKDNAQYYNIRGQANYFLHNYSSAVDDFNRVIKFFNGSREERREAYFWRGLAEISSGQKENGCLDLRKAGKLGFAKANEVIELYCQ